jgi:hypothetical protein
MTFLAMVGLSLMVSSGLASAQELWGTGSPEGNYWDTSGLSPVIVKFDPHNGLVNKTFSFEFYNWMWINGLADSGKYLYASHNTWNIEAGYADYGDLKIAKIDRVTGVVLSDTSIAGFLGQIYSQVNALDFKDGKLYGVENATWNSTIRGYAMEILLDTNGDVVGATKGAFVGPYPDCGLDFHDGLWYATSWGYSGPPKLEGSLVYTSPDIMNIPFTQLGSGSTPGVKGIGMIDGWEFEDSGNLLAVTWYNNPLSATGVYSINTTTWTATFLYDLSYQLPAGIISLNGLSEVALSNFCIEAAKIDWKKKPEADKILIMGAFNLPEGATPDPTSVTITIGGFTFSPIAMEVKENGKKWEYKHPNGTVGIKDMKIEWKKKEAKFEIHIDDAELGPITGWKNPVLITLRIGSHGGYESILMKEKKDKWEYHK